MHAGIVTSNEIVTHAAQREPSTANSWTLVWLLGNEAHDTNSITDIKN